MFEITKEELKQTIERPDKIMECKIDGICCYIRKIKGKSELVAITERAKDGKYEVKCFGWLQNMFYPS